jgi:hypothetical protein
VRQSEIVAVVVLGLFLSLCGISSASKASLSVEWCKIRQNPKCPDFVSVYNLNPDWQQPSHPQFLGLVGERREYANALQRDVDVIWFEPAYSREDDGKLEFQAYSIVAKLQSTRRLQTDFAVVKGYWISGEIVRIDTYIFRRDSLGQWHRALDGKLAAKIIDSHLH